MKSYIKNYYGSHYGLFEYYYQSISFRPLQRRQHLNAIASKPYERLVFVCMGNICRSPLGDAVANKAGFNACSAGIGCGNKGAADPRAVRFAESHDIDLHSHKTTPYADVSFSDKDLLVLMDMKHVQQIEQKFSLPANVTFLRLWTDTFSPYIHDPYNTNERYFEHCSELVMASTLALVKRL